MLEGLIVSIGVFFLIGLITLAGARYTVYIDSPRALIGAYILFLTLAQFFAAKIASFDFGFIAVVAPVGVIVFPFTLQITDMVNERFGRRKVYEMIWIALASQICMVVLLLLATMLPMAFPDPDPLASFAIVPSITMASWIAFLVSERFDAWIYDLIRGWIDSQAEWYKYLWIRNVVSDILSLALDSMIFVPLAFNLLPNALGAIDPAALNLVTPWDVIMTLIIGQIIAKWFLGLIDTPFMYLTRWIYELSPSKTTYTDT
ncbi:MAG: queuosine precursor transporter [Candidatus Thorarchaeota archaeon]